MLLKSFPSLIFEEKELKQLCLKNKAFFIAAFSCFVHSKVDLWIPRKRKFSIKMFTTYLP